MRTPPSARQRRLSRGQDPPNEPVRFLGGAGTQPDGSRLAVGQAALADSVTRKRLLDVAAVPMFFTPAEFGAFMVAETDKWAKIVKLSGVKAE